MKRALEVEREKPARAGILRVPARLARAALLAGALAASLAPSGCRRSHVAGTPSTDAVLGAFKDASLDVSAVSNADADNWGADVCSSGRVAGVEVVICEFTNEQQLGKTEEDTVRDWSSLNVDTGVVTRNGRTLLLIVDRNKQDPYGRAIGRMVAAFNQTH